MTGRRSWCTSVKGEIIDAWYSGKHRDVGANIQAIMRPDGLPVWTSDPAPGHLHDLTCADLARHHRCPVLGSLPTEPATLADSGYDGTGRGIHTPIEQSTDGNRLAIDNRTYNSLLRSLRCQGERGFALLTGRWRALRHVTSSPTTAGDIVRAALVLTHFEPTESLLRSAQRPRATSMCCGPEFGHASVGQSAPRYLRPEGA